MPVVTRSMEDRQTNLTVALVVAAVVALILAAIVVRHYS